MDVYGCMWLSLWKLAPKTDAVMLRMIDVAVYRCDFRSPIRAASNALHTAQRYTMVLSSLSNIAAHHKSLPFENPLIAHWPGSSTSFMWSSGALCSDPTRNAKSRTVHSPFEIRSTLQKAKLHWGNRSISLNIHRSFKCSFTSNVHHLAKLRTEKKGWAESCEEQLEQCVFFLRPIWGPPSQISYDLFKILSWYQWKTPRKTPQSASFSIAPPEFQNAPSHTPKQGLVNFVSRLAQILETGSMVDLSWNKFVYSTRVIKCPHWTSPNHYGIWSIMATIRWCPIFPKWDIYQPLQ